jgi:hypothetical protein
MTISFLKKHIVDANLGEYKQNAIMQYVSQLEDIIRERDQRIKDLENDLNWKSGYIHLTAYEYDELMKFKRELEELKREEDVE